jgi:4-diphosphocytidyl-2-C-methyl-D-erythritol kinase
VNFRDAPLAEAAPAKINLALHVTGRRDDGYHLLESLAVFTRLGDRIEARPAPADGLALVGPFAAGLETDAGNLVVRAREALRQAYASDADAPSSGQPRNAVREAVSLRLSKHLPVAAGVGGGSSDAAATLKLLNRLWRLGLAPRRLAEVGGTLGADVPMCLAARPLVARGIGEAIEPVADFPPLALVLVNPGQAVATPAVFSGLAAKRNPPLPPLPRAPGFSALAGWLAATRNDLEGPATTLAPAIADALAALRASGAAFARMSGSGATCFGLFGTVAAAQAAATRIAQAEPSWFAAATQSMGS